MTFFSSQSFSPTRSAASLREQKKIAPPVSEKKEDTFSFKIFSFGEVSPDTIRLLEALTETSWRVIPIDEKTQSYPADVLGDHTKMGITVCSEFRFER
ncbi:MAG: hypothetical protein ACT4OY_01965 [Alphaproteobacteria bacterium]